LLLVANNYHKQKAYNIQNKTITADKFYIRLWKNSVVVLAFGINSNSCNETTRTPLVCGVKLGHNQSGPVLTKHIRIFLARCSF